jgi:hypothetical protein
MKNPSFEQNWNTLQQIDQKSVEVNKNRKWEAGETIPKGTVCLLKPSDEKNTVGVKELLVVITSTILRTHVGEGMSMAYLPNSI